MIDNIAQFNIYDIIAIFGENSILNLDDDWTCNGVSIDSRSIKKGNLFVALRGSNIDGHSKIFDAIKCGAAAAIVEESWYIENQHTMHAIPIILTTSALVGIGKLASYHRDRFNIPVIAIAGSNGKTTTKDIATHILKSNYNVLSTFENYNNQLGVPLMLLQLNKQHDIAVIEIGTNSIGEISYLSSLLKPTHGLITNIGREHLEELIDLRGVEIEETSLFGELKRKNGLCFINNDDLRLKNYSLIIDRYMTYGTSGGSDLNAKIELDSMLHPTLKIEFDDSMIDIKMITVGYSTALNALAATAIAIKLGVDFITIKNSLEIYEQKPTHNYARMALEEVGYIRILNDTYNANPESMLMSLKTLTSEKSSLRKIAILGDMKELGEHSIDEHISVLDYAIKSTDLLYLTGNDMKEALVSYSNNSITYSNIMHFDNVSELIRNVVSNLMKGDLILVKGSRSMRMENIVNGIKAEFME